MLGTRRNRRIETKERRLILVENALNLFGIVCLGECKHQEDAGFLRIVEHCTDKAFAGEFANRRDESRTDARVHNNGGTSFLSGNYAVHDFIRNVGVT